MRCRRPGWRRGAPLRNVRGDASTKCPGTAKIFGHDIVAEGREIRGLIGYMPETNAFIAGMSAVRLIRLMAELNGLPPREALERAHEGLFYVGLGEAGYRKMER